MTEQSGAWFPKAAATLALGVSMSTLDRRLRSGLFEKRARQDGTVEVFIPGYEPPADTVLDEATLRRVVAEAVRDSMPIVTKAVLEENSQLKARITELERITSHLRMHSGSSTKRLR